MHVKYEYRHGTQSTVLAYTGEDRQVRHGSFVHRCDEDQTLSVRLPVFEPGVQVAFWLSRAAGSVYVHISCVY